MKIKDINGQRMTITVRQGKGKKDRITHLSKKLLGDLRQYYKAYSLKIYLFEGESGNQYTASSVRQIVAKAGKKPGLSNG
ncbi:MAG: tyrosine-type recombinase/integrase [Bacteroidota bacterium]